MAFVPFFGYAQDTLVFADSLFVGEPVNTGFEGNLDSLLNSWYVNQSLESMIDDNQIMSDTVVPDFPDSVYIERLAAIPSVVDLTYNRLVKNYINVYTRKRREQVKIMLGLSDYYFPYFEQVFDYYGIPYELKYLSIIESALNPNAVSRARAVGLWQFMYGTARVYGLNINSLVDERRDPIRSTDAAARFLKDLYGIYGDWTLALAAYNCGPGNVNKAIRRSGGKRNFWDIYYYLPRETRGYVPAFIAATYTMNYYQEHNLSKIPATLPLYTDTIQVREELHLKQVAEVLGLPVDQLRDLNPQYRYDIIPASSKQPYSLKVPFSMATSFIDLQDSIFAYKDSVFFNKDNLSATPQHYTADYKVELPSNKYDKLYYTVKSGDNLGYIADWYDVRLSDLRYWNNISKNMIRSGQKLVVYKLKGSSDRYKQINTMSFAEKQKLAGRSTSTAPAATAPPPQASATSGSNDEYVTYVVKSGDTLWAIAKQYPGVSDTDIARLNNLTNGNSIKPGQVIRIKKKS